jgi:LmbE family N-acetylglucosaminyl deacetylase
VDISAQANKKMAAIGAYRSQFEANPRNRQVPEWVRSAGRFLGSRIGVESGEGFFTREPLGLTGLGGLVL